MISTGSGSAIGARAAGGARAGDRRPSRGRRCAGAILLVENTRCRRAPTGTARRVAGGREDLQRLLNGRAEAPSRIAVSPPSVH
jgi:hypothetical protein